MKSGEYTYQGVQGADDTGYAGDDIGEFRSPFGIAVDPNDCGHVYVADTLNERIQIFTKDMEIVSVISFKLRLLLLVTSVFFY